HMRHKGIKKHRSPAGVRENRRNEICHEGQAHHDEYLFDRLEAAVDREIPENNCYRNDEPCPGYSRNQLDTASYSDQVCRDQSKVGGDENERGGNSDLATIVFAQYLSQPLLRNAPQFRAGELLRLIE